MHQNSDGENHIETRVRKGQIEYISLNDLSLGQVSYILAGRLNTVTQIYADNPPTVLGGPVRIAAVATSRVQDQLSVQVAGFQQRLLTEHALFALEVVHGIVPSKAVVFCPLIPKVPNRVALEREKAVRLVGSCFRRLKTRRCRVFVEELPCHL